MFLPTEKDEQTFECPLCRPERHGCSDLVVLFASPLVDLNTSRKIHHVSFSQVLMIKKSLHIIDPCNNVALLLSYLKKWFAKEAIPSADRRADD